MVFSIIELIAVAVVLLGVLYLGPKYIPKIAKDWKRAAKEIATKKED